MAFYYIEYLDVENENEILEIHKCVRVSVCVCVLGVVVVAILQIVSVFFFFFALGVRRPVSRTHIHTCKAFQYIREAIQFSVVLLKRYKGTA